MGKAVMKEKNGKLLLVALERLRTFDGDSF